MTGRGKQETWANKAEFVGQDAEKDLFTGSNDGLTRFTIRKRPPRARLEAIPRFVTVRGGGYFFLPSITALRFLSGMLST